MEGKGSADRSIHSLIAELLWGEAVYGHEVFDLFSLHSGLQFTLLVGIKSGCTSSAAV